MRTKPEDEFKLDHLRSLGFAKDPRLEHLSLPYYDFHGADGKGRAFVNVGDSRLVGWVIETMTAEMQRRNIEAHISVDEERSVVTAVMRPRAAMVLSQEGDIRAASPGTTFLVQEEVVHSGQVLRTIGAKGGWVVIYDSHDEAGFETEEYYGYFASPEEARQRWREFSAGLTLPNAKLCLIVEEL